ncbi:MAG TPA: hypothetical protein PKK74_07120 [Candidatus Methanoculleus thermohydrogenotrophicum]|jgi:hypothetical protein|nr:hypothetical protein [Candidatus Methanoculleus thermohydrogenotrophicum]NLM81557.1 hypothetical protein [Candidatus Methanoculleus thermohydrogenotrophicum]HOB18446.1 hypothetical protein [Candidatus Methanoculleus thermohydrogenotrophicum]HPZ38508.1 hypothetical protein [Candidatus Methanoculleus thermohydrogenotrophicum]HQC91657.1 hypothetical protein [Candidatus Methanoculleus thermohydrogenotrophicum]
MSDHRGTRRLPVIRGQVQCTPDKVVSIDLCGFCVHSALVVVGGEEVPSPARAYCSRCRVTSGVVDMAKVEAVVCDDVRGEGFRSITSIIS